MLAGVIEEIRGVDVDAMTRSRLEAVIVELRSVESAATAQRLAAMAALDSLGDGGQSSDTVVRSRGLVSAKRATREKHTADVLGKMPETRRRLAAGSITAEHADAAVAAAERCGDAGRADEALSDRSDVPADLFARRAKEWADQHETQAEIDSRAQRQHRNRRASFGRSKEDGSWTMFVCGESSEGRELRGLIDAEADRLFRDDGGRDNQQRPRTDDQRRFDALASLVRRGAGGSSDSQVTRRPHPKYLGVVTIPITSYLDPADGAADLVGSGPLPRSVLQRVLCDAQLTPLIVDDGGRPLFAGRSIRTANDAQWRALIVRDGGCVVCGADPSRCEAHHLVWWEHGGDTDITNLVLLCTRHHHQLHDHDLELTKRDGSWRLQPRQRRGPRAGDANHPHRIRRATRRRSNARAPG